MTPRWVERWYRLAYHPTRARLWASLKRFCVVAASRRSGKTEMAKRKLVTVALEDDTADARFFAAAPTLDQAKALYWEDLQALSPPDVVDDISESELTIYYVNGSRIRVLGLDKPQRVEGRPWDGGVLDEVDDLKRDAWKRHVRPALADRGGWCWFIGAPNGRGLLYELSQHERDGHEDWGFFTWTGEEILPLYRPGEIEALKAEMDEDTYALEILAQFNAMRGRAYKAFADLTHCAPVSRYYDPEAPLIVCLDFNVEPGAAVICQEMRMLELRGGVWVQGETWGTGVIGEVHIPLDSSTPRVCRKIANDWRGHAGEVWVFGDPSGGSRSTSQTRGTDWDLVRDELSEEFPDRVSIIVSAADPGFRARIAAVNARCRSKDGTIRLQVDYAEARNVVKDLEGVRLVEGGSGEISKRDPLLTHWTDALAYYLVKRYPARTLRGSPIGEIEIGAGDAG